MPKFLVPPVWAVLSALAMLALHRWLPGGVFLPAPWTALALLPVLAGIALVLSAARLFVRAGTPLEPWASPTALVAAGPYRFTRNPMYLGLSLCLAGLALWLGTVTPPLVLPLFVLVITFGFIRREERKLEERFGAPYRHYRARVRRWI